MNSRYLFLRIATINYLNLLKLFLPANPYSLRHSSLFSEKLHKPISVSLFPPTLRPSPSTFSTGAGTKSRNSTLWTGQRPDHGQSLMERHGAHSPRKGKGSILSPLPNGKCGKVRQRACPCATGNLVARSAKKRSWQFREWQAKYF